MSEPMCAKCGKLESSTIHDPCPQHAFVSPEPEVGPRFQGRFCVAHKEFDCGKCRAADRAEPAAPEPRFPVGKCKSCGKDVGDAADGKTIVFCSYECYCND